MLRIRMVAVKANVWPNGRAISQHVGQQPRSARHWFDGRFLEFHQRRTRLRSAADGRLTMMDARILRELRHAPDYALACAVCWSDATLATANVRGLVGFDFPTRHSFGACALINMFYMNMFHNSRPEHSTHICTYEYSITRKRHRGAHQGWLTQWPSHTQIFGSCPNERIQIWRWWYVPPIEQRNCNHRKWMQRLFGNIFCDCMSVYWSKFVSDCNHRS